MLCQKHSLAYLRSIPLVIGGGGSGGVAVIHCGGLPVDGLTLVVVVVVGLAVPRRLLLQRPGGGGASPRVVGRLVARLGGGGGGGRRLVRGGPVDAVSVVGALVAVVVAVAVRCLRRPVVRRLRRAAGARRGVAVVVVLVQAEAGEPEAHSCFGGWGRRWLAISWFGLFLAGASLLVACSLTGCRAGERGEVC
ncbi:hypothetical protein SEVIR_5G094300v4 [Setaria viridis]|uniref:Uncharacterized protein n=1 Tax=Setaria viridis TaxID=4556 RepID=A0A4U6UC26_SETVI|nr:hypothetical protein SEVIR_5G094300v2 [Setaria viridis]